LNKSLLILGAGGHAKVIIETARRCGYVPTAVFDDDESLFGTEVSGVTVTNTIKSLAADTEAKAIIAIGSNRVRKLIAEKFKKMSWITLLHPNAYICSSTRVGEGSLVCAGVVIQPDAVIGNHVIINTGAKVDHDCNIENYCHICPGAILAGGVKIKEGTMVGTGSSIIPLKSVGSWSTIGAGSVVVKDIPAKSRAWGVPAKVRQNTNSGSDQKEIVDKGRLGRKKC
jgi:sugar O-acyltransferase (sialic acid O-acetyltransferase NeuD family)